MNATIQEVHDLVDRAYKELEVTPDEMLVNLRQITNVREEEKKKWGKDFSRTKKNRS